MRQKTIREAVAGAVLVTLIFSATPSIARTPRSSASPLPGAVPVLDHLERLALGWLSSLFDVPWPAERRGGSVKAATSIGTSPTSPTQNGNAELERGSGLDPLGLQ